MNTCTSLLLAVVAIFVADPSWIAGQLDARNNGRQLLCVYEVQQFEISEQRRDPASVACEESILLDAGGYAVSNPFQFNSDPSGSHRKKWIYDRQTQRVRYLDLSKKTFEDYPVCGMVQFRVAELEHRHRACAAFEHMGLPQVHACTRLEMESILGLKVPGLFDDSEPAELAESVRHGIYGYSADGFELARFQPSRVKPGPELSRSFNTWLAHTQFVHPRVRRAIRNRGYLPKSFSSTFRNHEPGQATTSIEIRYRLKSAEFVEEPDWMSTPNELTESFGSLETWFRAPALRRLLAQTASPDRDPDKDNASQKFYELLKQQKNVAALMQAFRYLEITGDEQGFAEFNGHLATRLDPLIRKYSSGRFTQDDFELLIDKVSGEDHQLTAVAEYLLADTAMTEQWNLGSGSDGARSLLVSALRRDPWLSGAWLDLGRICNSNFDMMAGWKCWDISRRIAPRHRNLEIIDNLMDSFERDYPDFF